MLTQAEKFQAIEQFYPKMPRSVKAQIAQRLVTLDNVRALILAHVRHTMTSYEHRLSGQHYGCQYKGVREDAMVRVYQIVSDWK